MGKGYRYQENITDQFYVTLPSDSSDYYFPTNTIADFRTKLATTLKLKHDIWEVILVEISYPKGYEKLFSQYASFIFVDIIFPVKHYEYVFDLLTNMPTFSKRL